MTIQASEDFLFNIKKEEDHDKIVDFLTEWCKKHYDCIWKTMIVRAEHSYSAMMIRCDEKLLEEIIRLGGIREEL